MFARFCIYFNHHKEEPSMDIQTLLYELKKYEDSMLTTRRDLHKHAETGWQEYRTTALLI